MAYYTKRSYARPKTRTSTRTRSSYGQRKTSRSRRSYR